MIVYLDTSAAMKLVVEETESAALAGELQRRRDSGADTIVSSLLLHTELHCAANRRPQAIPRQAIIEVLSTVALVDVEPGDLTTAPLLPGRLRSADAIHLATALRVNAGAIVVYDQELASGAATAGIDVIRPG